MSEPSFPPANIVMNNSSSVSKSKKKRNKKKNKKAGSSQQSPAAPVPPTEAVTQGVTGTEGTTEEFASNDSLNQDEAAVTAPTTPEEQPKVTENVDHPEEIGAGEQGTVEQPEELGEQGTVEQPEELGEQGTVEQPEELGEQETVEQPKELGGQESTLMPPQRRDTDQDPSPTVPTEDMLPSAVTPDVPEKQEEIKAPGVPLVQTQPLAPIPVAARQLPEKSAFQEPEYTISPPLPSPFEPKETFPSSTEPFVMEQSYHELSDNEESCVQSAVQSKFIDIDSIMKQVKENIDKGMYETPRVSHGTFGTSDAVAAAASATGAMPASSTTTADTTTDENVNDDTTKSAEPVQEDTVKQPEPAVVNEQPVTAATDTQQNVATTTTPTTIPTEQDNVPQPASANVSQQAITDNVPQPASANASQQAITDNVSQQPPLNDVSQQPDSTVASRPPKPNRSSQIRSSIISAVKKRRSCIIL